MWCVSKPPPFRHPGYAPSFGIVSNSASATVRVTPDPFYDATRILGKVFEDLNRDGWQDPGERGVPNAMVVLDDGTYTIPKDNFGEYYSKYFRDKGNTTLGKCDEATYRLRTRQYAHKVHTQIVRTCEV